MSNIETDNMEKESYVNCNLELGDIIEIESSDNTELHEKMFYILEDNSLSLVLKLCDIYFIKEFKLNV